VISLIYEQPIYPKNLWLNRKPMQHAEYNTKVIQPQIRLMQERGVFTPPSKGAPLTARTKTARQTATTKPKRRAR